jgi:hypothetical protein
MVKTISLCQRRRGGVYLLKVSPVVPFLLENNKHKIPLLFFSSLCFPLYFPELLWSENE